MRELGEILVEKELICQVSAARVAAIAAELGKPLGATLEELGLITEQELAEALAQQYKLRPLFDFARMKFPPQLLELIPAEVALEHTLFPLKREGDKLAIAVADPAQSRIVRNLGANHNLTIIPYVSTKSEITRAICKHYFGKELSQPSGKTVLLVDDNLTVLTFMKDVLSRQFQVLTATDGMEAYKEAVAKQPHVVLTDMDMPKLDGFALLHALRAVPETRGIPIILVSGTASDAAEAQAFERGFFDYLHKPVKESTLLTRVRRACDYGNRQRYPRLT
jgi:CheY-like chemotaxis protein